MDATGEAGARPRSRFPGVARAALVVAGALPWALPLLRAFLPLGAIGAAVDASFYAMCHRLPERTLSLAGVAMPLCSRCSGIFAGVAIGAIVARPALSNATWRRVVLASCAPMVIDVATQDLGVHPIWHPTRIASGLVFGYALAAACITAIERDAREATS